MGDLVGGSCAYNGAQRDQPSCVGQGMRCHRPLGPLRRTAFSNAPAEAVDEQDCRSCDVPYEQYDRAVRVLHSDQNGEDKGGKSVERGYDADQNKRGRSWYG